MTGCAGILAGVGSGKRNWIYSESGQFLNVCGINNHINVIFNLNSKSDIYNKLSMIYSYRDKGCCTVDAVNELEEKIRTLSNFVIGGSDAHTNVGISENFDTSDMTKGKVTADFYWGLHKGDIVYVRLTSKLKSGTFGVYDKDGKFLVNTSDIEMLEDSTTIKYKDLKESVLEGSRVKPKKGKKYYTYDENGSKVEHIARGPVKVTSEAQKKAAENARKYAHTSSAEAKRRKTIKARADAKILGV